MPNNQQHLLEFDTTSSRNNNNNMLGDHPMNINNSNCNTSSEQAAISRISTPVDLDAWRSILWGEEAEPPEDQRRAQQSPEAPARYADLQSNTKEVTETKKDLLSGAQPSPITDDSSSNGHSLQSAARIAAPSESSFPTSITAAQHPAAAPPPPPPPPPGYVNAYVLVDPANQTITLPRQLLSYTVPDTNLTYHCTVVEAQLLRNGSFQITNSTSTAQQARSSETAAAAADAFSPTTMLAPLMRPHKPDSRLAAMSCNRDLSLVPFSSLSTQLQQFQSSSLSLLPFGDGVKDDSDDDTRKPSAQAAKPSSSDSSTMSTTIKKPPTSRDSPATLMVQAEAAAATAASASPLTLTESGISTGSSSRSSTKKHTGTKRKKRSSRGTRSSDGGAANNASPKKRARNQNSNILKPLSSYNFFFQDERQRLLMDEPADASANAKDYSPEKMAELLNQHWFRDRSRRRVHRRSHGKVDFASLTKIIAARWKALPEEGLCFYRQLAARDQQRYQEQLSHHRAMQQQQQQQHQATNRGNSDNNNHHQLDHPNGSSHEDSTG